MNNQPSLEQWENKLNELLFIHPPLLQMIKKLISQAKAQGAEEERKSCLKAFKADKYIRSDVKKTTKDLKTNKEFLRGYLSAQSDLQESKTQYMVSLTPQKEEKV